MKYEVEFSDEEIQSLLDLCCEDDVTLEEVKGNPLLFKRLIDMIEIKECGLFYADITVDTGVGVDLESLRIK